MHMLKLLIPSLVLALGCGGSDKQPVTPEPVAPAPADPALPPEPEKPAPAPALTLGAAKINLAAGPDAKIEVVLAADGTFTGTATEQAPAVKTKAKAKKVAPKITKKTGKLGEREALFDGKPAAKLGDDGTVSVSVHEIEHVEGKVVKDEATWQPLGVLDAEGVFTTKDGAKMSIGEDGKAAGFPAEMAVQVEAAPEMRRTTMFLVLAMMAGGRRVESGVTSSANTVPVEPIKSK